ncbi:structural maintenance of chromosome protein, putative [Bodo saltans]|uniref:Structural maintenance of chromosome protein, putative n=1 Tax=Bodo saltans TaxID=75058 RepID=A0A0S4J8U5_BODSA|nr:structural maintenance of chromosome protein, putative [Bodo saltans]|eukprot:CUG84675.1 structural maintenance of chromosome protein, putative [Bodo saltans]
MGISNLKKVRADDTRDLIYRAGAAGVQSARVTIEFINDDPRTAPSGYPVTEYPIITIGRQTQIGGKQRYFFMNRLSDQAKIKHFFQNIHLNVDNPHFMVLQGTVHKLIGMKSSDILALVEEAVGTKVFDVRRRTAENLIRGKERRLEEINKNLQEIGPSLEAMRSDQVEYDQYLRIAEALETNRRFRIAFQFWSTDNAIAALNAEKGRLEGEVRGLKESSAKLPGAIQAQQRTIHDIHAQLKEPEGAYTKLHEEETEAKKELQRTTVQLSAAEKTLKDLKKQQKEFLAEQNDCTAQRAALKKITDERSSMESEAAECTAAVNAIEDGLRLHRSGVRAGATGVSLEEELGRIDYNLVRIRSEMGRLKERIDELETTVAQLQHRVKHDMSQGHSFQSSLDAATKKFQKLTQEYQPYADAEKRLEELRNELRISQQKQHEIQTQVHSSLDSGLPLQFHHDPIPSMPDIDQKIYGRLGQLVQPKDPSHSMALSIGSQSHLMKLVVEDDSIIQSLVDHGKMRQRTSFLPLSQVQSQRLDPRRLEEAARVAAQHKGFATLGKDLVKHDARFGGAVAVGFGNFLVCSNLNLARALVNNPKVAIKSVTVDGEVVDPMGTMTGGSIDSRLDVLARIQAQTQLLEPLTQHRALVQQLESERAVLSTRLGKGGNIKRDLEIAEDDIHRCREQLRALTGTSGEQLERDEADLRAAQARLPTLQQEEKALAKKRSELEQQTKQDSKSIEASLEKELIAKKKRADELHAKLAKGATDYDRREAEVEQRELDLQNKGAEWERENAGQQRSFEAMQRTKGEIERRIQLIHEERNASDVRRRALEKDGEDAETALKALKDRQDGEERALKDAEGNIKVVAKSILDEERKQHDASHKYPWLLQEKPQFGLPNGPYHFTDVDATNAKIHEIIEAEALCEKMSRRVNKKSTVMYEGIRKDYEELLDKRETLTEDRQAILEAIHQVEAKKWASLDKMVEIVSRLFSTLFSACLPGAASRLVEERNDHGHIVGLLVKVSFNGKEKESLTELSGGQRSLLALCLILAILRLKPAPIYILDEVDAALDPSHTQNIGRMLQQHFSESQFLLVSLKDGMFNHANVLFEVRNTKGYSEITRKEAKR